MLTSELHDRLAERFPQLIEKKAFEAVARLLIALQTALVADDRVEIRGFGSFSVSRMAARSGRNPRTGAAVSVPAKWRRHFKPGKALRGGVERRVPTTRHQGCAGRHRARPSRARFAASKVLLGFGIAWRLVAADCAEG